MNICKKSYESLLDSIAEMWSSLKESGYSLPDWWNSSITKLREKQSNWGFEKVLNELQLHANKLLVAAVTVTVQDSIFDTITWIGEVVIMWYRDREKLELKIA